MSFMDMGRHIGGKLRKDWHDKEASVLKPLLLTACVTLMLVFTSALASPVLDYVSAAFLGR